MTCSDCGPYRPCPRHENSPLAAALASAMEQHAAQALAEARRDNPSALGHVCDMRCAPAIAAIMGA